MQVASNQVFTEKCTLWHNVGKFKGKLRLDGYPQLMRSGKDGPLIRPGDAVRSELIRRVTLSLQNKDFMPAEGKPALTEAEIPLIRVWITAGATPQIREAAMRQLPTAPKPAVPLEPLAPDYRRHRAGRACGFFESKASGSLTHSRHVCGDP